MASSSTSLLEDSLGESWVDLSEQPPDRLTPLPSVASLHLYNGEMNRLLWEAQKESNQSSARVSGASTRRGSPKSPPNSPNTDLLVNDGEILNDIYINNYRDDLLGSDRSSSSEWVWDWSSRPDQVPPKEWNFRHPITNRGYTLRHSKVMKYGWFSPEVWSLLFISNLLSLIVGFGLGTACSLIKVKMSK